MTLSVDAAATPRQRLLRFAAVVGGRFGHERSCKLAPGTASDQRHLVTFARRALRCDPDALLDRLASGFGWPASANEAVLALWPAASHVHLGLEGDDARTVWKLYLESASANLEPLVPPDPAWGAVHRAFKWSAGDRAVALTRTDYDGLLLPGAGLRRRLAEQVLGRSPRLLAAMLALISRAGGPKAMLLRVTDRGTNRASIDLNLYPMRWRVGDLRDELIALAGILEADPARVQDWIDRVAGQPLGHLAAGFDASGRPFATVYHGVHDCDGSCPR